MNAERSHTDGPNESTPAQGLSQQQPAAPGLVVCPVPVVALGVCPGMAGVIYRFAYERALITQAPSAYELLLRFSPN